MSNEPGGRGSDQVLSGYWGVESIALSGGNGLQAAIHGGERERERPEQGPRGGGGEKGVGKGGGGGLGGAWR